LKLCQYIYSVFGISPYVLAVTDVFFAPDEKKCVAFLQARKNVATQNRAEGVSPNTVLCSPSRPTTKNTINKKHFINFICIFSGRVAMQLQSC
jgi:hypothetical protein